VNPAPAARPELHLDNIPACLRERPQWVMWRYVTRKGKRTKIPFEAASGREASSTDPATWGTFEQAVNAWRDNPRWSGIGFVFAPGDPYCGVDLDDAIDTDLGTLKPWAREIVDRLDSYCEVSPSGWGLKLFVIATKPGPRCRKEYQDGEVEMYTEGRFFTVTGWRRYEVAPDVTERQEAVNWLYKKVFGSSADAMPLAPPADPIAAADDRGQASGSAMSVIAPAQSTVKEGQVVPRLGDEEILEKARRSGKSGSKFAALWAGRWDGYFNSHSEADSSLVFLLAFYTKDPAQLDRLFRRSGLFRDKWDEKHGAQTYGRMTIDNALATVTGQWQPKEKRAKTVGVGAATSDWRPAHLTQQVNCERLVQVLAGDARYNVNQGEWCWYDGRRFADDHGGHVARAAKRVARQTWDFVRDGLPGVEPRVAFKHGIDSEKASGIAAMMKLAQTEAGIPARAGDFDADPYLFNCLNGTLDLRTGTLRPHHRADLLTKLAPLAYDPSCPCPLFEAFLRRIMADNPAMIAYLRRVLGRCLSGDISEQELYFFLGEGANGKSVLIDTVLGILGDYAGTAPESLLTVQSHNEHPTEIADLCGKRLVVASETEEGAKLKVQLVKRLTGDGRIKGRFMRQDFFEFDRTHKLIIVSNNKPLIRETKHAIWRRIRLVPFGVIIPEPERDPQLTEKLKAEWPGILAWLIEGYRDWRQGGMRTPPEVLLATQNYQNEQDPLGDYLADRCITGAPTLRVGRNDLFTDYASWCQQTGDRFPLSRNALFDHIRSVKGVGEDQWRVSGQAAPVRGFRGIGLAYCAPGVADLGG
jgi:putative DNA primase/helicase